MDLLPYTANYPNYHTYFI